MNPSRTSLLGLTLLSLTLAVHAQDPGSAVLVRTLCVGQDCATANRFGALLAPAITATSTEGTLLVDGRDPLAPCTERMEAAVLRETARCVKKELGERLLLEAMKEDGHDAYLVQILSRGGPSKQIQGVAILLAPSGDRVESLVTYMAMQQDDRYYANVDTAPAGVPLVIDIGLMPEQAAMYGVRLPPRREVYWWNNPMSRGAHAGIAAVALR